MTNIPRSLREAAVKIDYLTLENMELRATIRCLIDNDPDDMAADGVTVLDVWRHGARRQLGIADPVEATMCSPSRQMEG